jgi:plastocyanin domain-containing protein
MTTKILLLAVGLLAAQACNQSAAAKPGEGRVVPVQVDGNGFTPSRIELPKGQSATLRFTRTTDATCAKKVVFPALHLEKDLPLQRAVDIGVPTDVPRTLTFQCGMGMMKSSVVVD